jgi:anti-anti-sigma factor
MPTRITQIENCCSNLKHHKGKRRLNSSDEERTILKVEGTLHLQDAELLERICRDIAAETGRGITLDLASIDFIDSDSASVLCQMRHQQDVTLEGLHLFIENVIRLAEKHDQRIDD